VQKRPLDLFPFFATPFNDGLFDFFFLWNGHSVTCFVSSSLFWHFPSLGGYLFSTMSSTVETLSEFFPEHSATAAAFYTPETNRMSPPTFLLPSCFLKRYQRQRFPRPENPLLVFFFPPAGAANLSQALLSCTGDELSDHFLLLGLPPPFFPFFVERLKPFFSPSDLRNCIRLSFTLENCW